MNWGALLYWASFLFVMATAAVGLVSALPTTDVGLMFEGVRHLVGGEAR